MKTRLFFPTCMLAGLVMFPVTLTAQQADGWATDFGSHTVPLEEITSGGPPKDGIPALDEPHFVSVREAGRWLDNSEPVAVVELDGVVKAYPLQILIWHEIVNDLVGSTPISVTYCPLCNSTLAFDRRLDDRVLDFGTTGHERPYGQNPYEGYDTSGSPIRSFFRREADNRLPAMERVVALELGDEVLAYPFSLLSDVAVINDEVAGRDIVVFWAPGTASAVDEQTIAKGRDVGTSGVFDRTVDGRTLVFEASGAGRPGVQVLGRDPTHQTRDTRPPSGRQRALFSRGRSADVRTPHLSRR